MGNIWSWGPEPGEWIGIKGSGPVDTPLIVLKEVGREKIHDPIFILTNNPVVGRGVRGRQCR